MIEGSCHCGKLRWTFHSEPERATACNCTICRRYGALWIYGTEGDVINTRGVSRHYSRGDHSLDFHFCAACGCLAYYSAKKPNSQGQRLMAANLRMVEDLSWVKDLPVRHFDGLDSFKSLPDDGRCVSELWF